MYIEFSSIRMKNLHEKTPDTLYNQKYIRSPSIYVFQFHRRGKFMRSTEFPSGTVPKNKTPANEEREFISAISTYFYCRSRIIPFSDCLKDSKAQPCIIHDSIIIITFVITACDEKSES